MAHSALERTFDVELHHDFLAGPWAKLMLVLAPMIALAGTLAYPSRAESLDTR